MNFKNKLEFIKSFLKDPKKIALKIGAATAITVGTTKLSAQELSGIRDKSITPIVEAAGHSFHSNTFAISNFDPTTLDFLMKSFVYRYGREVSNKLGFVETLPLFLVFINNI